MDLPPPQRVSQWIEIRNQPKVELSYLAISASNSLLRPHKSICPLIRRRKSYSNKIIILKCYRRLIMVINGSTQYLYIRNLSREWAKCHPSQKLKSVLTINLWGTIINKIAWTNWITLWERHRFRVSLLFK